MLADFASKRVTVMGLGRFGGGGGVTRWLACRGADVLLTDLQPAEKLQEPLAEIADLPGSGQVALRLGEHNVSDFTTGDLVVANPAVPKPWENRFLRSAQAAGVPITTEIRLLIERVHRSRVIGVTGSAGKSTTAAMIHHLLVKAGHRAHLGGNIGGSLLNNLEQIQPNDWITLELSSAMLHWLGQGVGYSEACGWSPRVAVLTNLVPNHLDWHGSFEHYQTSKLNIFKHQEPGDAQITDRAIDLAAPLVPLSIPGSHNQLNAQLAIAAVQKVIGIPTGDASEMLSDFPGLPHRLQLVLRRDGRSFYNDSKSTTPQATVLAVSAFDDLSGIHLIAGGYDKGSALKPIADLAGRIAGLYTIGATGNALAQAAHAGCAQYCDTLEIAVERAWLRMKPGDILLLSPGCASWDQFTNYEQRGEAFVKLVNDRIGQTRMSGPGPLHQSYPILSRSFSSNPK